jgi:hypothetical protein
VDALDHVGAIEDKRLVALALEAPVVLLREVELLQGRAHAAVEDDDALADGGEEIPVSHDRRNGRRSDAAAVQVADLGDRLARRPPGHVREHQPSGGGERDVRDVRLHRETE